MKIRRFTGKDTREVMRQITDTLGSDAVILSTKRIPGGVEMIAATEYTDAVSNVPEKPTNELKKVSKYIPEVGQQKHVPEKNYTIDNEIINSSSLKDVKSELQSLRGLLEHQLSGLAWHDLKTRNPHEAEIIRRLLILQFEPTLARNLAAQIATMFVGESDFEIVWEDVLLNLAKMIQSYPVNFNVTSGACVFLGGAGSGKSLTIAKVAANYVLENQNHSLGILSFDANRIAASDKLKTYAKILGVPMRVVSDEMSLRNALDAFYDKQLILVDTTSEGAWQADTDGLVTKLSEVLPTNRYLMLPATEQYAVIKRNITLLQSKKLHGCVITKVDEAVELGEILSAVIQHDLPVCHFTDSQSVPEGLHKANSSVLVNLTINSLNKKLDSVNQDALALKINGLLANE